MDDQPVVLRLRVQKIIEQNSLRGCLSPSERHLNFDVGRRGEKCPDLIKTLGKRLFLNRF